jgi:hypothetical protein
LPLTRNVATFTALSFKIAEHQQSCPSEGHEGIWQLAALLPHSKPRHQMEVRDQRHTAGALPTNSINNGGLKGDAVPLLNYASRHLNVWGVQLDNSKNS